MWAITIAKAVTELACMVGSEVIVGGIVKQSLNGNTNKILGACSKVASFAVAGVMGAAAGKYADEMIDQTVEMVTKAKEGIQKSKEAEANG